MGQKAAKCLDYYWKKMCNLIFSKIANLVTLYVLKHLDTILFLLPSYWQPILSYKWCCNWDLGQQYLVCLFRLYSLFLFVIDWQKSINEINSKKQKALTIGRSITVRLTYCLTGLDLTEQVKLLFIQHKQSRWIQAKNRGSTIRWYFPLRKCSLQKHIVWACGLQEGRRRRIHCLAFEPLPMFFTFGSSLGTNLPRYQNPTWSSLGTNLPRYQNPTWSVTYGRFTAHTYFFMNTMYAIKRATYYASITKMKP